MWAKTHFERALTIPGINAGDRQKKIQFGFSLTNYFVYFQ
jgi:hypothetical protein